MTIHLRTCDDWVALYIDGKKVDENHSLNLEDVLTACGVEFTSEDIDDQMDDFTGELATGDEAFPEVLPS